jgi:hypothetical protein
LNALFTAGEDQKIIKIAFTKYICTTKTRIMKNTITFILGFILFSLGAQAQDYMTLTNGETKEVKIIEIGTDEIKFKKWPASIEDPVIGIEKIKVKQIRLASGEVYEFGGDAFDDKMMYANQNKNAVKINFLSPLAGTFYVGYERSIKPGQSFEGEIGIIGAGFDVADVNPRGVIVRAGYKFIKTPNFYMKGMRYSHLLKGIYVKPELIFATYGFDQTTVDFNGFGGNERITTTSGAIMLDLGWQTVFSDVFLIDLFFGLGYGFSTNVDVNAFGFIGGNEDFPIAVAGGLKIGFLF